MWGFTEKEIENWLVTPKRGRKTATITIGDDSYVVLSAQQALRAVDGTGEQRNLGGRAALCAPMHPEARKRARGLEPLTTSLEGWSSSH